jgi:polycomb-like protein 2
MFILFQYFQIDLSREQCLVKFGDNTDSWSVFSRLTKLSTGFDVMCVKCKTSQSKPDNDIVVCDKCSRGYHQLCHIVSLIQGFDLSKNLISIITQYCF